MAAACQGAAAATMCEQSNQALSSKSRKVHKADREKLRRDKLNEQFAELASALDTEKPKHDKASILGDSLQVVKELRNEITKLKTERGALFEESNELKRERDDLEEEKTSLQKETEELSFRLHECVRASLAFITTAAANQTDDQHTRLNTTPSSVPAGSHCPTHGAAENMSNPFVYLSRPSPAAAATAPQVERPCARYAAVDAVPDFLSKVQSSRGFQPTAAAAPSVPQSQLEDDDNDIQLHLGQPRTLRHPDSVQAHEVDTDLQLKVSVPVSEPAHGGGL